MKAAVLSSLLALSLVLAVGCANKKTQAPKADSSALDVSAAPAYQPAPMPPAPPMVTETPINPAPVAPVSMGGTHIVKKGDTLYSIAKVRYGDGKQWTKIQQANPGITPQSLKVGQTLVIP